MRSVTRRRNRGEEEFFIRIFWLAAITIGIIQRVRIISIADIKSMAQRFEVLMGIDLIKINIALGIIIHAKNRIDWFHLGGFNSRSISGKIIVNIYLEIVRLNGRFHKIGLWLLYMLTLSLPHRLQM